MTVRRLWKGYPIYVWPLALVLVLQIIYLIAEIAFNASLLNVASGASGGPESLDKLEVFGRIISGVGLGLLIFSSLFSKPSWARKKNVWISMVMVASATIIFPASVYTMWHLQSYLVEDVIVGKATDEERYAATYIQYVSPSIRQGVLSIDELPLDRESLDRPETKTLLTLLMPVMMQNDDLVASLKNTAPDMIKFLSHRTVLEELDNAYSGYNQAMEGMDSLYKSYRTMAEKAEEQVVEELKKAQSGYDYRQLVMGMTKYYDAYKQEEGKAWYDLGNYVRKNMNHLYHGCRRLRDPVMGQIHRMSGSSYCFLEPGYEPPLEKMFTSTIGFAPSLDFYCPGGFGQKECIAKSEIQQVARKTYEAMPAHKQREFMAKASRHRFKRDLDGIPIGLSVREFFAHPKVFQRLTLYKVPGLVDADFGVKRNSDGSYTVNPDGYLKKRVYYTVARELASKFQAEVAKQNESVSFGQVNDMLPPSGIPGRVSVTREEFNNLTFIDRVVNAGGDRTWDTGSLKAGLSKDEFFDQVMIKDALETVSEVLNTLPQSVEEVQSDPEPANAAIRAVYVPAIALAFSLFFSLTNIISVIGKLNQIGLVLIPSVSDLWAGRISKGVQFGGLALVLVLPVFITPNTMTQSKAMEVAAESAEMPWAKYPLQWVMAVQPLIYPVGNATLGVSEMLSWYQYYDGRSAESSTAETTVVSEVDVQSPFTVKELQAILQRQGHYRGTVDGVIGPMTTRAIKRFQRSENLTVTGFQDHATIFALSQHSD